MTFFYLVKDYIEVVHKLIETAPSHVFQHSTYTDSLTLLSFGLSSFKQLCINFLSFEWLKQLWYFPIIVPEIATSMMEEISVLDGNFHNLLTFLDKPIAVGNEVYGNYYLPLTCFEKLFTGLINSLFIWLPTSTATFICFRRFIMQGVEAGYSAALGTMAATLFWLTSIIFGLRFIVVPWMSLDLFRYWLGFLLLMKYFWDNRYAYKEVKHNSVFGKQTRRNIFAFHFLLALTEQTSLYPFLSNFSISSQSTLLEGFPSENIFDFTLIHFSYLLGIAIGSYSLINLLSWFWQDPAYRFYFWIMNKFKKLRVADIVRPVHLFFQSITVLFAFSSLPYFGIEYQVTNPLGFVPNDQVFHQFKQTSFLTHSTSPAYYRSRLNFPRQKFFRYEDWAEYYHRNTPIDTSLYDQGAYRLYTMEDLSYGKDYEWMRRRSDKIKIRSRLKRLRWFPRNWANRLWEFTKTWSRRNVLWRNDILNMYQYSWDSKAPIIWNKLVFEEFFPTGPNRNDSDKSGKSNTLTKSEFNNQQSKFKPSFSADTEKNDPISKNWDSFWGPDPDWTTKFLSNKQSLTNTDQKFSLNYLSRFNVSDNDVWWKWLSSKNESNTSSWNFSPTTNSQSNSPAQNERLSKKTQKSDFWEPQNRLISIYSENTNLQKQELNLESSTLRKFVRKLTARFKLANINQSSETSENKAIWSKTTTFPANSLKTLLITPSLRDWTVFQTLLANINSVLWWRRFSPSVFSLKYNLREPQSLTGGDIQNLNIGAVQGDLSFYKMNQLKQFIKREKFEAPLALRPSSGGSDNISSFEKIQNKYFEIQNRRNLLMSDMNSIQTTNNLKSRENEKLATSLKLLKPKVLSNDPRTINFASSGQLDRTERTNITGKNTNFLLFLNNKKSNTTRFELPSVESSSTLLHPVKYYLHKEQNFKRKLRFYGVKTSANFDVSSSPLKDTLRESRSLNETTKPSSNTTLVTQNAQSLMVPENQSLLFLRNKNKLPIFNFYLKTYFQTYKKTKLYVLNTKMKRQLGMGASARRKGRDYSNKLLKRSKILSNTPWIRQWIDQSGFLARRKRLETWIARQHYDPNELWAKIMKTDVDLFMKRQPSSYFLTTTEENLLHLRRFLLFEYYDTLRWYTYMTNYRSMKNTIGGTKSFTNKLYNQQFKGTFHKVRHLFSLTPSASNGSLLKFDRPLYNLEQSNKFGSAMWDHEELTNSGNKSEKPLDLLEQSSKNLQQSIWQNNSIRKNFISGEQKNASSNENSLQQTYKDSSNYNLLTTVLMNENSNIGFPFSQKLTTKYSNASSQLSLTGMNQNNSQNEIIKNNLQKRLMMRILQIRKKQKWTMDYKRASEKLWKKWKLQSNIQKQKSLSIYAPQTAIGNQMVAANLSMEQPYSLSDISSDKVGRDPLVPSLTRKLGQIKKLELFVSSPSIKDNLREPRGQDKVARNISANISGNSSFQEFSQNSSQFKLGQIFNQNIFTRKLINDKYKRFVKKSPFFRIQNLATSESRVTETGVRSLNFKLRQIINNRTLNPSRMGKRRDYVPPFKLQTLSNELSTQNNIQLYEMNKIRQERSNIQNLVFMKKFLVNDNSAMLTRSQLRPLPGKRTKALYDKLGTLVKGKEGIRSSSSGFNQYFVSSILDKDLKILFYKNRNWMDSMTADEKLNLSLITTDGKSRGFGQELYPSSELPTLSRLNSKWKLFLNTVKNSPELVSNKLDKTLQTKLIKDQNEKSLTTTLSQDAGGISNIKTNMENASQNLPGDFFAINTSSLRDSSGFKNIAIQKLTKTLLSKQKNLSANLRDLQVEKPITSRITKSARKRQQDFVTRSLLKRHLNLKSRRKLFLKTKEINNQRMVLDRKYEIQERVFLNQLGFLSEVKKGLETPLGSELNGVSEERKGGTMSLLPNNRNISDFDQRAVIRSTQTENLGRNAGSVNFLRWLTLSKNSVSDLNKLKPDNRDGSAFLLDKQQSSSSAEALSSAWKNQKERNLAGYPFVFSEKNTRQKPEIALGRNSQRANSKVDIKQSYLSSTKRSTLFIDKILNQHKNQSNKNYLNYKLKSNFAPSSSVENEKSSLRRTLRKFSLGTSIPASTDKFQSLGTTSTLPIENSFINNLLLKNWISVEDLKKRGSSSLFFSEEGPFFLWEKAEATLSLRPSLLKKKDKVGFFSEAKKKNFSHKKKDESKRPALLTGLNNRIKLEERNNVSQKTPLLPLFSSEARKNRLNIFKQETSFSEKMNRKSESGLINLNKYISFARTNQNKLSRQQIRKKLKKRRIIRMKRTERLKTLKDHPLKFRSEQIQTFYNIRDSLKKWKDFSFISEKNKYTKSFWEVSQTNLIPVYETSGQFSSLNSNKELQKLRYKPLNLLGEKASFSKEFGDPSSSDPNTLSNSNFYMNPNVSGAVLHTLYRDIFLNSDRNLDNFDKPKTETKPLLVNTTNMPFYAGWDDSLRKFVLTNRLLNRREAGYQSSNLFGQNDTESLKNGSFSTTNSLDQEKNIVFSLWPLRGTNPATTLFSQFPFMTAPQTNLNYSPQQIRSIKSGTKYDLETSINFNKLPNQAINSEKAFLVPQFDVVEPRSDLTQPTFDKKWKQKYNNEVQSERFQSSFAQHNYLNFKKTNRIKSFIKSSKNDDQIGIRQSGQVVSNLANPATRKIARHALFAGRSGVTNFKKFQSSIGSITSNRGTKNPNSKLFVSRANVELLNDSAGDPQSIDKKMSTKILLLRNLRQGNRAQTKLAYIRRLQKTLRPTGSSWKTNQVLSRRKKQRIKQNNLWGQQPQNEASTRFSVRKRKKRGNNKNPRLRGDKNYKKTKRQYRQKLYLRPKNKPLRRRSLGVTFKNKLNYWRRNYQYLSLKDASSAKDLKGLSSLEISKQNLNATLPDSRSLISSQNLKDNSRYSQRDKEWKFEQQSSVTRRPRQLYRSLFKNPNIQTPILYTTLPGHSRSIPLIKNLPLPGSSVKTLNRVIKWSSADGASRFYRVNLSYGWAMTLFLNNLRQNVNSENPSSVNSLIKSYLNELEKTNQTKFSSSREFKRRFYKLRQLSYTMSLRLYDRWFFYYYKTTNSNPQGDLPVTGNLPLDQKIETNINNKIKESILGSASINQVEQTLSPLRHIKKFLTFHISFSRKEKELENQSNFRSYLKNLRNTAISPVKKEANTQNRGTDTKQTLQNINPANEDTQSNALTSSLFTSQESSPVSNLENRKTKEFSGLDNFKLFPSQNKDSENSLAGLNMFQRETNFNQSNLLSSDKNDNQDSRNTVKSNKTLLKKEKKYAEDRFFFAQFNKPPLVDDYRLTLETNRHYPLNGGFVWPGDYLRLQTILLPKEMKDQYLSQKNNASQFFSIADVSLNEVNRKKD